jgi:hypothetical protein
VWEKIESMEDQTYPEEILVAAHKHTVHNEAELRRSERCACLYCGSTVIAAELDQPGLPADADEQYWPDGNWVADADPGNRSAACPTCRIDALIGDASGYPIAEPTFQIEFGKRWWGETPITRGESPSDIEVVCLEVE